MIKTQNLLEQNVQNFSRLIESAPMLVREEPNSQFAGYLWTWPRIVRLEDRRFVYDENFIAQPGTKDDIPKYFFQNREYLQSLEKLMVPKLNTRGSSDQHFHIPPPVNTDQEVYNEWFGFNEYEIKYLRKLRVSIDIFVFK